jgi:RNA polymerase sigma-70 factor (ECF subfamily)
MADVQACLPSLERYAIALLRDHQDARDLVHDCVVQALSQLHRHNGGEDVRPWLFSIMHNLFISETRKRHVRNKYKIDTIDTSEPSAPGSQEDRLHRRDLKNALNQLPEDQRLVLLLVSVGDLSYAAAAKILRIPAGTVMSRLSRGRENLRKAMGNEDRPRLWRVK